MLTIIEHAELTGKNTLALNARARYFIEAFTLEELQEAIGFAKKRQLKVIPLGSGSNVVLAGNLEAVVIQLRLMGRRVISSHGATVLIEAGAGEDWHEFVCWTLKNGVYGLENLSLIPGCVGAAPVQNIGAYGVELKDYFSSLMAVDTVSGETVKIFHNDCSFDYRHSIFKGKMKDRYIITSVQFQLNKKFHAHLDYGGLRKHIEDQAGGHQLSATLISRVIAGIRREKLPDPKVLANAGSFFKNPIIDSDHFNQLIVKYPDIVAYINGKDSWKLAAAWLIERAGLKGIREGAVGTHKKQALVLINYGGATGEAIIAFSNRIKNQINEMFGVMLEQEPRLYK